MNTETAKTTDWFEKLYEKLLIIKKEAGNVYLENGQRKWPEINFPSDKDLKYICLYGERTYEPESYMSEEDKRRFFELIKSLVYAKTFHGHHKDIPMPGLSRYNTYEDIKEQIVSRINNDYYGEADDINKVTWAFLHRLHSIKEAPAEVTKTVTKKITIEVDVKLTTTQAALDELDEEDIFDVEVCGDTIEVSPSATMYDNGHLDPKQITDVTIEGTELLDY